jgi:hypothetical protein
LKLQAGHDPKLSVESLWVPVSPGAAGEYIKFRERLILGKLSTDDWSATASQTSLAFAPGSDAVPDAA